MKIIQITTNTVFDLIGARGAYVKKKSGGGYEGRGSNWVEQVYFIISIHTKTLQA